MLHYFSDKFVKILTCAFGMLHILLHIDYYVSGIRGRVIQLFVMRGEHYTSIFTNTQIQMQQYKYKIQLQKYN